MARQGLFVFLFLLGGGFCAWDSVAQEAGLPAEATALTDSATPAPTETVGGRRIDRSAPPPQTALDLSNGAAQITFLIFIVLFLGGYLILRRQPSSRPLKKGNKRKR